MFYPFLPVLTFFLDHCQSFKHLALNFELVFILLCPTDFTGCTSLEAWYYYHHVFQCIPEVPPLSHIEIVWTMLKSQVHPSKPSHLMNCGQIFRRNCARIMLIATECLWLRWILQSDIQPNTNEATWVYRSYNFDSVPFRDTPTRSLNPQCLLICLLDKHSKLKMTTNSLNNKKILNYP